MIIQYIKSHFTKDELVSILDTFISDLLYSASFSAAVNNVIGGDLSQAALYALGLAIFRSLFKAVRVLFTKKEE